MFECPGIKLRRFTANAAEYCVNCGRETTYRKDKPVHIGRRVAPRRWIKIARATA